MSISAGTGASSGSPPSEPAGSCAVEVRSASTGRLLHKPVLGDAPHDVGFDPEFRSVWFSNWNSGSLTVVDPQSRRVRTRIRVGQEPHHFAAGAGALWVTDHGSGALLRIDLRSRRLTTRTLVGEAPHHVAVAGQDVLVAVHGSGEVALATAQARIKGRLRVGNGPHGVAAIE